MEPTRTRAFSDPTNRREPLTLDMKKIKSKAPIKKAKITEEDYTLNVENFREAAVLGSIEAIVRYGICLRHGYGVAQDFKEALRLFEIAVENNSASGQYQLAICYDNGMGVDRNEEEAERLYTLAALQGYQPAIEALNNFLDPTDDDLLPAESPQPPLEDLINKKNSFPRSQPPTPKLALQDKKSDPLTTSDEHQTKSPSLKP